MPRKKAPNGSGMLPKERPDGRWEARYSVRDPATGRSVQKSVYARTQEECAKKLRKVTAAIDDGTHTEPTKMQIRKWADIWLAEYCGHLKERTADQYEMHVRLNIKPYLGGYTFATLGTHNIQIMCNTLLRGDKKGRKLSPKSIRNMHGVIHSMLEQAQRLVYCVI